MISLDTICTPAPVGGRGCVVHTAAHRSAFTVRAGDADYACRGVRYDDDGAFELFAAAEAPSTAHAIIDHFAELLASFGAGLQDDVAILAIGSPATYR